MVLWETEFYALSVITGSIETFRGMYIKAPTIVEAMSAIRVMDLDYLQLTGSYFADIETANKKEEFYKGLESPKDLTDSLDFDGFVDWLGLALSKDDLLLARSEFEKVGGLEEHIKIINIYINKYDNKDKEEDS